MKSIAELKVRGSHNEEDSFLCCLKAICEFFHNKKYSYDILSGLSGAAFSPAWNGDESTHFAVMADTPQRIEFLSKTLGFFVKSISIKERQSFVRTGFTNSKIVVDSRDDFYTILEREFANNKIIILGTWPTWSVLTGWDPEISKVKISTTSEYWTRKIWGPEKCDFAFSLEQSSPQLDYKTALIEALKYGAEVANQQYFLPKDTVLPQGQITLGGSVYKACSIRMSEPQFCRSCSENQISCLYDVMRFLNRTQISLKKFLCEFIQNFSEFDSQILPLVQIARDMASISVKYINESTVDIYNYDDREIRKMLMGEFDTMYNLHVKLATELSKASVYEPNQVVC